MENNVIGSVPEFTTDEEVKGTEQVDESTQATTEEVVEEEKVTPTEPVAVETPVEPVLNDDTGKQIQGLLQEKEKLLNEIKSLRGTRREIKQDQLLQVNQKLDDLKDVNPEDVNLIEKVIRSKGYITKEEASQMSYKAIEQDEVSKFLDKFPEYKPENDPNDLNWSALQREFALYRRPDDPRSIGSILSRAHQSIVKTSDRGVPEKVQQVKTAGIGSGGSQRSSSPKKSLDPDYVYQLKQGGFTDEDIQKMEARL